VWCCLIHHEGFSPLDSFENYPLIGYVHHANPIKIVNQSWTCLQLKQYFSSICYHQPSWKLPSHIGMHPIACRKRLIIICSIFFSMDSSQLVKSDCEKKCVGIINNAHHPYSCGKVCIWASKQMVTQSVLVGASFWHPFKCNCTITSVGSHNHFFRG